MAAVQQLGAGSLPPVRYSWLAGSAPLTRFVWGKTPTPAAPCTSISVANPSGVGQNSNVRSPNGVGYYSSEANNSRLAHRGHMSSPTVLRGDALEQLASIGDNSIDAIITDPPYGLTHLTEAKVSSTIAAWLSGDRHAIPAGKGFGGEHWDAFVPPPAIWDECFRVLKPGGHLAAFAGARTQDELAPESWTGLTLGG